MTRFPKTSIVLGITVAALLSGCVRQSPPATVCAGTLELEFYSQTRCQSEWTYPGEVSAMFVGIFDGDEVLVTYLNRDSTDVDSAFTETFDLPEGLYSAVAWTGIDKDFFRIEDLREGNTTREDLFLSILRDGNTAADIGGAVVLQGESPAFYISTREKETVSSSINLLELTNRLTVSVSGLPAGPERYSITIVADNGSLNMDGSIAVDESLLYEPSSTDGDPGRVVSDFTLLRLETGHTYQIVITDTVNDIELYRGSLLGALILKNPEIDLQCDHDFYIEFTAEDQCACGTYAITEIWVNNWLVHSYSTDF